AWCAVEGGGAYGGAGREGAAGGDGGRPAGAVAAQGAAVVDEHGRRDRAVHAERAVVDEGRPAVGAVAGEHGRPAADLKHLAGTGDRAAEGVDIRAIEVERLV